MCTFRRPAGLTRALAALAEQEPVGVAWDVVVVDNDPAGRAIDVVASLPSRPPGTRVVVEPEPGSANARNRGIAEATGDIVVIIDDDVVPARDWLGRLLDPIIAGRCDATGGRVILDPTVPRPRWLDEQGIGGYLTLHDPSSTERPLGTYEYVVTANAAFRADLLRRTGGFVCELGPSGRQQIVNDDVSLCRRFRGLGGTIHHVPGAVVVHDLPVARLSPRWLLKRSYLQGRSDWILDREEFAASRFAGASCALGALRGELSRRWSERLWRRDVAFHAACDVARAGGALREVASILSERAADARRWPARTPR